MSLATRHLVLIETNGRHVVCGRGSELHTTDACAQHQPRDSPHSPAREVRPPCHLQARQRHTQTSPHTFKRGSGISCTRLTPARSISLTTRHLLLLVKRGRRVVCRRGSGTHRPLHTHLGVAVTSAARDRRLRAACPATCHLVLLVKCGRRRRFVCRRGSGISCTQATLVRCLSIAPRRLLRLRKGAANGQPSKDLKAVAGRYEKFTN